jgi:GAF domain-containing protein
MTRRRQYSLWIQYSRVFPPTIIVATSGEEALRMLLAEREFACILLDVQLPGISGIKVAEMVRQNPRLQRTPILFLTGFTTAELPSHAYELGGVDFLQKPVRPEVLRAKVRVFVELARERAQVRALNSRLEQRVEERTTELRLLVEASAALLASLQLAEVLRTIIGLAQHFVSADAYAVWRAGDDEVWRLTSSVGLSDEYVKTGAISAAGSGRVPTEPVPVEDIAAEPILARRHEALVREGVRSMLVIPLHIRGAPRGTIVFYWKAVHRISESELRIATALGNLAASAMGTAELYDQQLRLRGEAEIAERRASFLAEAGAVLASSLDYQATLAAVAKLAVPAFADWAAVDLISARGDIERVAVEHTDPEKVRFAYEFTKRYPPRENDLSRVALRTGKSVLMEEIPDELVVERAEDEEHLRLIRKLGLKSFIVAPMVANGRSLGIVTFVTAESGRRYSPADLHTAEEIARRAASAIQHAALYREAREAREAAELLNRIGPVFTAELDPERLIQSVIQIATRLVGAKFGALFYNSTDERDEPFSLYALSGASREDFEKLPAVRHTPLFAPTFHDRQVVRADDVRLDPRFGKNPPHRGMPEGHLPVRSYLGVPVVSRSGAVLGALLFGHEAAGVFTERHEQIVVGIAAQAAIALDNARLFAESQRSNEELKRANADLEQFAYSASHDLKEPLRMVGVYSQMLQRKYNGKLDAAADEYLGHMVEGSRRMDMLIRDLLAYTQAVKSGDDEVTAVNTAKVLEQALANLTGAIRESGANIVTRDLPPALRVKDVHLLQVFQNVIGNAIKYRGELPPEIEITAQEERAMWRICVHDNGIGVPPEYAQQVFGIFRRLHATDKYAGTGIGLAICQRIVERYGGRIWVESEGEGRGSTFCFTLPGA